MEKLRYGDMMVGINIGTAGAIQKDASGNITYDWSIAKLNEGADITADFITKLCTLDIIVDGVTMKAIDRVAFFEMGNENSGSWIRGNQERTSSPLHYLNTVKIFIDKMNAAAAVYNKDLSFALMGAYNFGFDWAGSEDWEKNVQDYLDYPGLDFDFIAYHGYPPGWQFGDWGGNCNGDAVDYDRMTSLILGVNEWAIENRLKRINEILSANPRGIKLVNTEYASMVHAETFANLTQSITEAIYTADNIITCIEQDIQSAANFSLHHTGYLSGTNQFTDNLFFNYGTLEETPVIKTHRLLANNLGQVKISSTAQNIPSVENMVLCDGEKPTSLSYEKLRFSSTKDDNGVIYTLVLNNSTTAYPLDFNVVGGAQYCINQKTIRGTSYFSKYGDIIENDNNLPSLTGNTIEPYSINIYTFTPIDATCSDVIIESSPGNTLFSWDQNYPTSVETITVKSGSHLVIPSSASINFCASGKLLIEKGARVTLYGKLTSCSGWQGVKVDGNGSSQELIPGQYNFEMPLHQGMFVSDGGTIENAYTGVMTFNDNLPAVGWGCCRGGIIQCDNTTFNNNKTGVYLSPYAAKENLCYIKNTSFNNTNKELDEHIFIGLVRGIQIENCIFENDNKLRNLHNVGIRSANANFKVSGTNTKFENLAYGIRVSKVFRSIDFDIQDATFEKCAVGITNSANSFANIEGNTFYMGEMPTEYNYILNGQKSQIGIHNQGFIMGVGVKANHFENTVPNTDLVTTGIYIKDIGDFSNVVTGNRFMDLIYGNQAHDFNATYGFQDNSNFKNVGLVYLCNDNINDHPNTKHDFYAESNIEMWQEAICGAQGRFIVDQNNVVTYGFAGNTFSSETNAGNALDFYNIPNGMVSSSIQHKYYYRDAPKEMPLDYGGIVLQPVDDDGFDCNLEGRVIFPEDPVGDYNTIKSALDNLQSDYVLLVGNNSTETLANTTAAITFYQNELHQLVSQAYLHAVYNGNETGAKQWLQRLENVQGYLILVEHHIINNDYIEAIEVLDFMEQQFSFSNETLLDFQNTRYIYEQLMDHSIENLPQSTMNRLVGYADSKKGQACYLSRNILNQKGIYYPPVVKTNQIVPQSRKTNSGNSSITTNSTISISPNPSNGQFTLSIANKDWQGSSELKIVDIFGKVVFGQMIESEESIININSNLSAGVYMCNIYADGVTKITKKMVIN